MLTNKRKIDRIAVVIVGGVLLIAMAIIPVGAREAGSQYPSDPLQKWIDTAMKNEETFRKILAAYHQYSGLQEVPRVRLDTRLIQTAKSCLSSLYRTVPEAADRRMIIDCYHRLGGIKGLALTEAAVKLGIVKPAPRPELRFPAATAKFEVMNPVQNSRLRISAEKVTASVYRTTVTRGGK